ncbi:hypothetical protein JM18_002920 [Phytophthora kernoviae]|uniref:START domain-containing protein n=2 Tax=Phytophthora kernoviae TaxID=325452 RepID=A0A921VBX2_9STRA|nr:hypothetical protein G195_007297 [Phytophthora kernoviae 00238/432]KAG2529151.1 hypothetical protein JM18_002920 [Phytophthora kernoviae]
MSIALVDDQEAFEAALSFVDEYEASDSSNQQSMSPISPNDEQYVSAESQEEDATLALALDGLPSPTELALVETETEAHGDTDEGIYLTSTDTVNATKNQTSKKTKKRSGTAVKRNKALNYNPNRAREQQRKELLYLRDKVVEMERKLTALQGIRRTNAIESEDKKNEVERDDDPQEFSTASRLETPSVWKEMASHQLEQRLKSERENRRLKVVLEGQIKIGRSLEKLLEASSTTKPMESCVYGSQRTQRIHTSAPDRSDPGMFAELMAGVDDSYHEVDALFRANGLAEKESSYNDAKMREGPDGIYMEMFASKVLPFDVPATGAAAWQYFAKSMEHMPFRFFYQKDPQNLETTDDTIVESFGMELHANGTQADFRVKQILRRYVEEDRVVIVWRSFIDPVEFSGAPLRGADFREKGYIVIRRPQTMAPHYALLQTCYIVSPTTPVYSLSDEGAITGALTDFVLSGTAANIASGHQMIENILFNEAMKTHSRV